MTTIAPFPFSDILGSIITFRDMEDIIGDETSFSIYQRGLQSRNPRWIENKAIIYEISTKSGQSGCPLIAGRLKNMVVGIHKGGDEGAGKNEGRYVTDDLVLILLMWRLKMKGDFFGIVDYNTGKVWSLDLSLLRFLESKFKDCKKNKQVNQEMRNFLNTKIEEIKKINSDLDCSKNKNAQLQQEVQKLHHEIEQNKLRENCRLSQTQPMISIEDEKHNNLEEGQIINEVKPSHQQIKDYNFYQYIVAIIVQDRNSEKTLSCSGTLISANLVLTLASNLYDPVNHFEMQSAKVFVGVNSQERKCYKAEKFAYPSQYNITPSFDSNFAMIYLDQYVKEVSQQHHLSLILDYGKKETSKQICIFGCTYQENFNLNSSNSHFQLKGINDKCFTKFVNNKILYQISTQLGQRGCPIIAGRHRSEIAGIHCGSGNVQGCLYNIGRIFTNEMIARMEVWREYLQAQRFTVVDSIGRVYNLDDFPFTQFKNMIKSQMKFWQYQQLSLRKRFSEEKEIVRNSIKNTPTTNSSSLKSSELKNMKLPRGASLEGEEPQRSPCCCFFDS